MESHGEQEKEAHLREQTPQLLERQSPSETRYNPNPNMGGGGGGCCGFEVKRGLHIRASRYAPALPLAARLCLKAAAVRLVVAERRRLRSRASGDSLALGLQGLKKRLGKAPSFTMGSPTLNPKPPNIPELTGLTRCEGHGLEERGVGRLASAHILNSKP